MFTKVTDSANRAMAQCRKFQFPDAIQWISTMRVKEQLRHVLPELLKRGIEIIGHSHQAARAAELRVSSRRLHRHQLYRVLLVLDYKHVFARDRGLIRSRSLALASSSITW